MRKHHHWMWPCRLGVHPGCCVVWRGLIPLAGCQWCGKDILL